MWLLEDCVVVGRDLSPSRAPFCACLEDLVTGGPLALPSSFPPGLLFRNVMKTLSLCLSILSSSYLFLFSIGSVAYFSIQWFTLLYLSNGSTSLRRFSPSAPRALLPHLLSTLLCSPAPLRLSSLPVLPKAQMPQSLHPKLRVPGSLPTSGPRVPSLRLPLTAISFGLMDSPLRL